MKKKKNILIFSALILTPILLFCWYATTLSGVNPKTVQYYQDLRQELTNGGYRPKVYVISAKRNQWHNRLLTWFGAAKKSQHLQGNAVDILVTDVNGDGKSNREDVMIVKAILEKLVGNNGGIGTYMSESFFWNRQMVHFDCRGHRARWNR